jgi:hypothetical protein
MERDGLGREAWWWIANIDININGRQVSRRWSVDKHGDRGARPAIAQRHAREISI